jgi:hypothetical protein
MQLWICDICGQENEPEHDECIHCERAAKEDTVTDTTPVEICTTVCFDLYQGSTELYETCGEECMSAFDA